MEIGNEKPVLIMGCKWNDFLWSGVLESFCSVECQRKGQEETVNKGSEF